MLLVGSKTPHLDQLDEYITSRYKLSDHFDAKPPENFRE